MNREKVRTRSRKVPSPLLPVVIFASLGVVAVPVPPAPLHPRAIASNLINPTTNSMSQSQEEYSNQLFYSGEAGGPTPPLFLGGAMG